MRSRRKSGSAANWGPAPRQSFGLRVSAVLDLSAEFSKRNRFAKSIIETSRPRSNCSNPGAARGDGRIHRQSLRNGAVYVHCKIGYSRSAAAVAAYLIMSEKSEHLERSIRDDSPARPSIVIRPEVISRCPNSTFDFVLLDGTDAFLLALDRGAHS